MKWILIVSDLGFLSFAYAVQKNMVTRECEITEKKASDENFFIQLIRIKAGELNRSEETVLNDHHY